MHDLRDGFLRRFLTSYLVFHYNVGDVLFTGQGWVRPLYFSILIPHVILAGVIVPLALNDDLVRAARQLPPSSANRAMDLAAVDLCLSDRRHRVPDALPAVHADIFAAGNGHRRSLPRDKLSAFPQSVSS